MRARTRECLASVWRARARTRECLVSVWRANVHGKEKKINGKTKQIDKF